MSLVKNILRDMLGRIIKHGDYVVWANGEYGRKMEIAEVLWVHPKQVKIRKLASGHESRVYPENMLVITAQVMANIEGNVNNTKPIKEE